MYELPMHSPSPRTQESESNIQYSPTAPGEPLSHSPYGSQITSSPSHDISQKKLNEYMFKMVRYRHMDFELARFIMMKSILSPKQLYLHTKRSKQIKNQWHRDDPCITTVNILLLLFCSLLLNLSNPMSYNPFHLIWEWLLTSASFILLQFIVYGVVISMITKTIAEKYLRKDERSQIHGPLGGHLVEPMYSFDIHCNGFFPIILFNYFGNVSTYCRVTSSTISDMFFCLQCLMMLFGLNRWSNTIFSKSFTSCLLSNGLCTTGFIYYFYLMFRGYAILPFISKPQKFLIPIPIICVVMTLLTLFKVNTWNILLIICTL